MTFLVHACSSPRLAWQIASSLHFAPVLQQLAAQVASRISAAEYNGLHLRVEEDMHQFTGAEGGVEVRESHDHFLHARQTLCTDIHLLESSLHLFPSVITTKW